MPQVHRHRDLPADALHQANRIGEFRVPGRRALAVYTFAGRGEFGLPRDAAVSGAIRRRSSLEARRTGCHALRPAT